MTHRSSFRLSLLTSAALFCAAPAFAKAPVVVSDTPIVGALVGQVMGDLGTVHVLMDAGGDPHHYQLRPSQARSLQDADLLIWVGPQLTPWLTRASEGLAKGDSLVLLDVPQTQHRNYGDADGHDDHGHDHAHDDEGDHEHAHDEERHEGHDHSGLDPHAWLDPQNAQVWLTAIAETLATRDPENAATYRANAQKGGAEIAALDAQLATSLAGAKDKRFVVFHDAYGYFTEHYGLQSAIPVSLGDASTPSAARLRDIQQQVRDGHAVCAFPEASHDPKLLQVVIEGTGVRQGAALDPEGMTAKVGPGLYATMLAEMGKSFTDCLTKD